MTHWAEVRPSEAFHRVLAPDGTPVAEPPALDADTLLRLYRTFLRSRRYDEKTLRMQRRGEISVLSRSIGEEAIPIGSAAALSPGDWCFPTYRQTPALHYWDVPLARQVATLMGLEPETVDEHLPVSGEGPAVTFSPVYIPLAANVTNAVGSAMADHFSDGDAVTMAYVGEGSTSEGDFYEALNFAGVFDAPAVIVCHNNQWAISVPAHRQTAAETFAQKATAAGIPAERIDGNDVLAVYERTAAAVDRARSGEGPTLLECVTYRIDDHNTADAQDVYRTDEEQRYWEERDPLERFEAFLRDRDLLDDQLHEELERAATDAVDRAVERARTVPTSEPAQMFDHHLRGTSWAERHQRAELAAELAGENPFLHRDRFLDTEEKVEERPGNDDEFRDGMNSGTPATDRELTVVEAVTEALSGELSRDESVRVLGYDVGPIGGVFRATDGLYETFGPDRVIDTPLSENGILGTAVGMAMRGERVVPEIQFMGFFYPAFGQFMYALSKMRERSGGAFDVPLTVRLPYGGGIKSSEYHSESTETFLAHTPGVRVVCPSTPYETKGVLAAAVRHDDPVIVMEPKALYRSVRGPVPEESYTLPLDEARLVREGTDVTVVAWGAMVRVALAAAERIEAETEASIEVVDLRSLAPIDFDAVLDSVRKTGRCVIVHEARRTLGLGAELSARLNEHALAYLEAPVCRATGYDVHFPGHTVEDAYLPDADRTVHAIEAVLAAEF